MSLMQAVNQIYATGGFNPQRISQYRQNQQQLMDLAKQAQAAQVQSTQLANKKAKAELGKMGKPEIFQSKDPQGRMWNMRRNPDGSVEPISPVGAGPSMGDPKDVNAGLATMPDQPSFNAQAPWQPSQKEMELMSELPDGGQSLGSMPPAQRQQALIKAHQLQRERQMKESQQLTPYQEQQLAQAEQASAAEEAAKQAEVEEGEAFAGETLSLVKDMLNPEGLGAGLDNAVGSVQGSEWFPSFRGDTIDFDNAHDTLVSRLTKENLGIMKGVLSDNDIKMLKDIGSGQLKLRGSEEAYRKELFRIGEKLLLGSGVTEDDIQTTMAKRNMTRQQVLEALLGS